MDSPTSNPGNVFVRHRSDSRPIVVYREPPNYAAIAAAFPIKDCQPIFAYAPYIYNPHGISIIGLLEAHEIVHIERQGDDPAGWWEQYIVDQQFRLGEELVAHAAEYEFQMAEAADRSERRRIFQATVDRIRSPMYGYRPAVSGEKARKLLKAACRTRY